MDTRETLYPYISVLATQSQVHGMREIMQSKTKKVPQPVGLISVDFTKFFFYLVFQTRLFWVFLCLFCVVAAVYGIYRVVDKYGNDRIATKITLVNQQQMQVRRAIMWWLGCRVFYSNQPQVGSKFSSNCS